MVYLYVLIQTALNLVLWAGILFNLPGTWLMVLLAALIEWWTPEPMFGAGVLYAATGLALLGEVLEFALGAVESRQAGGSKRGAALAIAGGLVGAILGTLVPIPVLATLIGASLGAFAGSVLGDLWAGRSVSRSLDAGRGAALGRLRGTLAKMIIGGVLVVGLAAAPFL